MLSPGKKQIDYRNLALLGAFCLFLSAVEYMIPKPLPFLRIGLANLPLMLALDFLPFPSFLILILIKVIGQGIITGTLFSYVFLFSLTGTFLSALLMFDLRRIFGKQHISFIGIGTAGAFVSNISQLALAYFFIFHENVSYIAPPFLAAGVVTGILLGIFCEVFSKRSKWYEENGAKSNRTSGSEQGAENKEQSNQRFGEESNEEGEGKREEGRASRNLVYESLFSARALFIAGLLIVPALVFNPGTELRIAQFLFFCLLVLLSGKKTNFFITILIIVFIVMFNLFVPYGKVLFSISAFKITSGALTAGIHRAFTFAALVMLSKAAIRQDLKIPGSFGKILGESLRMFSIIMSRKYRITGKNFISDIDELMLELGREGTDQFETQEVKTKPVGYVVLLVVVAISWLPWII